MYYHVLQYRQFNETNLKKEFKNYYIFSAVFRCKNTYEFYATF